MPISMHAWAVLPPTLDTGETLTRQLTLLPSQAKSPYTFVVPRPPVKELIRQEDGSVWVPRAWGVNYLDRQGLTIADQRRVCEPVNFRATLSLRHTQHGVVLQTLQALRNDRYAGGAVIEGVPGSGKTVVCLKIAAEIAQPTLVVVHTTELLRQWQERIREFMDLDDKQIGTVQGAKVKVEGKVISVAMLQTLCKRAWPEDWLNSFGMLILDECDLFPTDVFRQVLSMFPARYRLACTATLKRRDGMHQLLEWHIGGVTGQMLKPEVIPKVFLIPHTARVNVARFSWRDPKGEERLSLARMLQQLANDFTRNEKLCRAIASCRERNRITIVLSHHKEHLATLAAQLRKMGYPPAMFTGDEKKEELAAARKSPLILGTYAMMGRGVDIPQIEAVVLALPLADVRQAVGRILRAFPGKQTPVVLDVVDENIPATKRMSRARHRWYRGIGAPVAGWNP